MNPGAEGRRPRILHVIEPGSTLSPSGSDAACLWLRTLIAQTPALHHEVLALGTQHDEDHLLAMGVDTTDRITPVRGRPLHAASAVERFAARRAKPDITLAWSVEAGLACQGARTHDLRLALVRRAIETGPKAVRARPGGAADQTASPGDAGPGAEGRGAGVWPLPAQARSREDIRTALEIENHELIVAVLSDRPGHADPRVLIWAVDMLRLIGIPATALASSLSRTVSPARRMMAKARMGVGMIVVDGPLTELMPACDVLVVTGDPGMNKAPDGGEGAGVGSCVLLARAGLVQGSPVLALPQVVEAAPGAIAVSAMTPSAIVDQIVPLWRAGFRPGDRPIRAAPEARAADLGLPCARPGAPGGPPRDAGRVEGVCP